MSPNEKTFRRYNPDQTMLLPPGLRTICRFRAKHADAFQELLTQVFPVCAGKGMAVVAFDGTKIMANANQLKNMKNKELEKEGEDLDRIAKPVVDEAYRADADDDAVYVDDDDNPHPEDLRKRKGRRERLEE